MKTTSVAIRRDHFLGSLAQAGLSGSFAFLLCSLATAQVWVDDDAPSDAGPNDPTVSGFEDGSASFPFDTIAEGLAAPGTGVSLRAGTYSGPGNQNLVLSEIIAGTRGADEVIIDLHGAAIFGTVPGYCELSGLTIRNGSGSTAGAIEVPTGGDLYVEHCVFKSNSATTAGNHGGAISACGGLSLWNCVFFRNGSAGNGGAVAITCDSGAGRGHDVQHTTFRNNIASGAGGGIYYAGIDTFGISRFMSASIFYGNAAASAPDIAEQNPGYVQLFDSITQVPWTGLGSGNFVANPVFVDPGDWHIGATSPANDAISGSLICVLDSFDADQQVRNCTITELGADEYQVQTHFIGNATPGAALTVRISGGAPSSAAIMTASTVLLNPPIFIGAPYNDFYYISGPYVFPAATTNAEGTASWAMTVPVTIGLEVYFQGTIGTDLESTYTQFQVLP